MWSHYQRISASRSLAPAIQDACHSPLTLLEQSTDGHSPFVDDNGVAAYRADIRRALHQSIESAYMIYGYPGNGRCNSCISDGKWEAHVNHIMEYFGFIINSVTWPLFKRLALRSEILIILSRERGAATPKEFASVLGKLRSASRIALWGHYIKWPPQLAFTAALRAARMKPKHFWRYGKICILSDVCPDLWEVARHLQEQEFSQIWTRPIALLVHRKPTLTCLSDASYGGIGGWFHQPISRMWRAVYANLRHLGFSNLVIILRMMAFTSILLSSLELSLTSGLRSNGCSCTHLVLRVTF